MKKLLSVILVIAGFSSAFAADAKPLISKNSGGGHMMPEYAGSVSCDVFQNKVILTNVLGFQGPTALKVTEERKIQLTGNILNVIQMAKAEKIEEKPNMMCDGPHTGISANGGEVLLYSTGGCGTPSKTRVGIASSKLVQIVDMYCPKTYNFAE